MPTVSSPSNQLVLSYAAGDVIADKYALEELIGEGGMGAVFRARNTTIDMPVAVKLIRADLDREVLSGRLLQEARAAAKLAHPAIVRVFDVGKTALGDPFIVMELLHGESLASVIDREGRLSSARAVQLLLPIADALSVAHAKGFVHRDVKPDNVFIANDDEGQLQPKLVDFGIVKHERQDGSSQLTQVGAVLGSPDYMSPEQARGLDNIDLRSDVWAFSVVLYEAITGAVPFESSNYNALLRLIVEAEPKSLREHSVADDELSQIVQRGLSKDPVDRFASMGVMGKALAAWLSSHGVTEDACGVSLETRWLSRSTDPSALGRVSRSSLPDFGPEGLSGVRMVSNYFGHAPTMPVVQQAGTPHSFPRGAAVPSVRARRLLLGGAGIAVLAALILGYLEIVRSGAPPANTVSNPPAEAQQPTSRAEPSAPLAPAAPVLAPAADVEEVKASVSRASASKPQLSLGPARPQPPASAVSAPPVPAPAPPAPPKSDLLAPY